MTIPAGQLREKITVKRAVRVQQPDKGWTTTWETILETFSAPKILNPSNDFLAGHSDFLQPFQFKIRFRPDVSIKIGDIIEWRGRTFKINGFTPDILRTYIDITAITDNETTAA